MSQPAFRFIHSADWHLERPLGGVGEVPEPLVDLFQKAPLRAARHVVDQAIERHVDFVVLSGDIIDPDRAGPEATIFLVEQFQRLAEHEIAVYWAGGRVDPPQRWPSAIRLPSNVHRFAWERTEEIVHQRDHAPIVRLIGRSVDLRQRAIGPEDFSFSVDRDDLFTIGVAYGRSDDFRNICPNEVAYWALGGDHIRSTPLTEQRVIHLPGTPQGRNPIESGPHGCTLVESDGQGHLRLHLLSTDVARWHHQRILVDANTSRDGLLGQLAETTERLLEQCESQSDMLICWTIAGEGPLLSKLRHTALRKSLKTELQDRFAARWPRPWCIWIEAEPARSLPDAWYEQDDLRGDFLRELMHFESGDTPLPDWSAEAPGEVALLKAAGLEHLLDHLSTERLLRRTAALGAELLSVEEPQP